MLRKISFSEVCKRLTDEGWGFDIYLMVVIFPSAVVLAHFAENIIQTAIMAVRQSQFVSLIYLALSFMTVKRFLSP